MLLHLKNTTTKPMKKLAVKELLMLNDIAFFKAIVARYPETVVLAGKAEASPEGNPHLNNDALAYKVFECHMVDPTAIEADRTFLGLLLFKSVLDVDHSKFPNLSKSNFNQLVEYTKKNLESDEDIEFVLYSLACNDLGKTQELIDKNIKITGKKADDHDQLLAELVEKSPSLFPGYLGLSTNQKQMYVDTLKANFNLGQMIQGENLPVNLAGIQAISAKARNLRLLTELYDFAGVTGHINQNISIMMNDNTFFAFHTAIDELMKTPKEQAYQRYIIKRATHVGILDAETNPQSFALGRIVSLARAYTIEEGKIIQQIWSNLPKSTWDVLFRELNETGFEQRPGVLVYYAPALIANAIKSTGDFGKGLEYALKVIADTYVEARKNSKAALESGVITINVSEKAKQEVSKLFF